MGMGWDGWPRKQGSVGANCPASKAPRGLSVDPEVEESICGGVASQQSSSAAGTEIVSKGERN